MAHHSFDHLISSLLKTRGTKAHSFGIQNIVSSAHFGHKLDLASFSANHGTEVSYDPKVFPGARCRMNDASTSILLFTSGNSVITGAKSESEAVQSYHNMHQSLVPFFQEPCQPHKDKGIRYNPRTKIDC